MLPRWLVVAATWGFGAVAAIYLMLTLAALDVGMGIWAFYFAVVVGLATHAVWWLLIDLTRGRR